MGREGLRAEEEGEEGEEKGRGNWGNGLEGKEEIVYTI